MSAIISSSADKILTLAMKHYFKMMENENKFSTTFLINLSYLQQMLGRKLVWLIMFI